MKYIHYVDFLSKTQICNFFNQNKKTRGGGFGAGAGGDENLIIKFYWPKKKYLFFFHLKIIFLQPKSF